MAPDFAYFVLVPDGWRHIGHTPLGLALFCIPAGLAAMYAFHRFFKQPLVLLLPRPVRAKLWPHCGPFPLLPLRRLAWISALIFIGALTHVVWDGFTHDDGWAARNFPHIKDPIITFARSEVRSSGLLQYGSSLLGLGLLAWWSWQWYRTAPAGSAPADSPFLRRARPAIAAAIIVFGAGVGTVCGTIRACHLPGSFDLTEFLTVSFIAGVNAFGLALLVFVATLRVWEPGSYRLLQDLRGLPTRQQEPEGGTSLRSDAGPP